MAIHRRPVPQAYTPLMSSTKQPGTSKNSSKSTAEDTEWRPVWTRRLIIFFFLACFLLLIVVLEIMLVYSEKKNGFDLPGNSLHYLWTYGPTALFNIIMALWHRVDYRIRQMAPWISMATHGPVPAARSVFSDYLSPTVPEVIFHSVRNRDFAVTAGTLIVNLLTVSTIISTGLLSLTQVSTTLPAQYQTTSKFVNNISQSLYTSSLAGNIYDAINSLSLPYPFGTTDQVVYQTFELTDETLNGSSSIQQVPVEVLTFDMDCEEATLEVNNLSFYWLDYCNGSNDSSPGPATLNQNLSIVTPECSATGLSLFPFAFGNDQEIGNFAFIDLTSTTCEPNRTRVFFGIGQAQQHGVLPPSPTESECNKSSPTVEIEVLRSKQWLCVPNLRYRHANVSFNSTTFDLDGLPEISDYWDQGNETVPTDVTWTLLAVLDTMFETTNFQNGTPIPFSLSGVNDLNGGSFEATVIRVLRLAPNATIDEMLNTDLYLGISKEFYKSAVAQTAHLWITSDDSTPVQGIITINESRLKVSQPSLRAIQSILGLTSLLLIFIIATLHSKNVIPFDVAHLSGMAQAMREDSAARSLFSGTGASALIDLRKTFLASSWRTSFVQTMHGKAFRFTVQHQDRQSDTDLHGETKIKWWHPWTSSITSRSVMLGFVVCLIIALQVLLANSNRNQGLLNVSTVVTDHYAWSLVPALLMTLVAIYVRALHAVYIVFAPYGLLQKGAVAAKTLCRNFQSMTNIEVLLHALRDHQLGVLLMTCSVVIAPFLTIVVSGAFTSIPVAVQFETSMDKSTWFSNANSSDNGTAGNSALLGGLILMANLSFPQWTYGDLTFASYKLTQNHTKEHQLSANATIRMVLPAIRPLLTCTIYNQEDIPNLGYYNSTHTILANLPGPAECAGNLSDPYSFSNNDGDSLTYSTSWFGNINLWFGSTVQSTVQGCPNLVSIWGYHAANPVEQNVTVSNVTYAKALSCFEAIEQVDVDVSLTYPSLAINLAGPPRPLENTTRIFSTADIALPYVSMPQLDLLGSTSLWFWSALLYSSGIDKKELGDAGMTDSMVAAFKKSHGIVRAQQYNVALRGDFADPDVPTSIDVTLTDWDTIRLVQDPVSTNILCALLIAIILCSCIASILIKTHKVLPKNPGSIAATMSLLADSNIFDKQYLWYTDADRQGSKFAKNSDTRFRMGWICRESDMRRVYTIHADDAALEEYEMNYPHSEVATKTEGSSRQKGPYASLQQVGGVEDASDVWEVAR